MMGIVTAIAIDPPRGGADAAATFYLVRLAQDRFAENLGTLLGLSLA